MQNYDEIYTEKSDGQIILQRNLVNLKFEFYTFVDISNIYKEKRPKAHKITKIISGFKHPNLLNIKNYKMIQSAKMQGGIILFMQEAPDHQ